MVARFASLKYAVESRPRRRLNTAAALLFPTDDTIAALHAALRRRGYDPTMRNLAGARAGHGLAHEQSAPGKSGRSWGGSLMRKVVLTSLAIGVAFMLSGQ